MMWGYGDAAMGLGGWLWMLAGLLVVVGLVLLVIWAVAAIARGAGAAGAAGGARPPARPEPLETLRERFARGDISEAEFEQAKRILGY